MLSGDSEQLSSRFPDAKEGGADAVKAMIAMIAMCVKSHNFIGEDDQELVFDEEMVKMLPENDMIELTCAITGKSRDELNS